MKTTFKLGKIQAPQLNIEGIEICYEFNAEEMATAMSNVKEIISEAKEMYCFVKKEILSEEFGKMINMIKEEKKIKTNINHENTTPPETETNETDSGYDGKEINKSLNELFIKVKETFSNK